MNQILMILGLIIIDAGIFYQYGWLMIVYVIGIELFTAGFIRWGCGE